MFCKPGALPHYFRYDPETGHLYWKQKRRGRNCNVPAGSINKLTKYVLLSNAGFKLFAHDIVWAYVTKSYPKTPVYHLNGKRWDNRFENLSLSPPALAPIYVHDFLRDQTNLKETFRYDEVTGELYWKHPRQGRSLKRPAGHITETTGHKVIFFNRQPCKTEYVVWLLHGFEIPKGRIRHINGNPSDNRIENLYDEGVHDFI